MKSPFKKLRDYAVNKHSKASEAFFAVEEESSDVTQGMQDVEDMRSQYEGLLTSAHIISGAAYDFSRSVQDMASYMMESLGQFVHGEIGSIFSMLAKVQFEISKLLDLFAAHVSQTIINPTELMISELQHVQAMKEEYDEKRQAFNVTQKDMHNGKTKNVKGDSSVQQLTLAKEDLREQAQALTFKLQSLKQGQSRSLITQAAQYHSAQMHLFSKGLTSISAMEPVMRQLAMEKNIDRSLSEGDVSNNLLYYDTPLVGDEGDNVSPTSSPTRLLEAQFDSAEPSHFATILKGPDLSSKSAPISSSASSQKITARARKNEGQRKISMYALPSPSNAVRGLASQKTGGEVPNSGGPIFDIKRPLFAAGKAEDDSGSQASHAVMTRDQSMKHQRKAPTNDRVVAVNENADDGGYSNKFPKMSRSYSHSGPITNKRLLANYKQPPSINNLSVHTEQVDPLYKSGPISRSPVPVHHTHGVSPPLLSIPQISELHKLPPPPSPASVSAGPVAHSAPLGKKAREVTPPKSGPPSPLPPPPPGLGARSLSIPASASRLPNKLEQGGDIQDGVASPPLRPPILPVRTSMI